MLRHFRDVAKEPEKRVIRLSLSCHSGGGKRLKNIFLEWFFKFAIPCGNGRKFEDFNNLLQFAIPCGNGKQIETM